MPIDKTAKIWMDGKLVDWDDARIHVLTHTLHYGSGVFEGIRAYPTASGPAVFRLTDHMRRLLQSAHFFMMEVPFTLQELVDATKETIRVNQVESCYIRPIAFLGYGEMGLNPLLSPVNVSIAVWPWGTYLGDEALKHGVRMKVSSWRRMDPNVNPVAAKGTGIYINSSLAKVEALHAGYDEAILLNTHGFVAECTGENIFVVKDGTLVTPPLSSGVPHRHRRRDRPDAVGRRSRDRRARRDHPQDPGDLLRNRPRRGAAIQRVVGICPRMT